MFFLRFYILSHLVNLLAKTHLMRLRTIQTSPIVVLLYRISWILLFMQVTRYIFYAYHIETFEGLSAGQLLKLFANATRFDLTAVCYANLPYILLMVLPFGWVASKASRIFGNIYYGLFNSALLIVNLIDTPFYGFTGMRTQAIHLTEILNDAGTADMLAGHFGTYKWFACGCIVLILLFLAGGYYLQPRPVRYGSWGRRLGGAVVAIAALAGVFIGIRGHLAKGKPIGVADASLYCSRNKDIALILNTPFSILRTLDDNNTLQRYTFFEETEIGSLRNDMHQPLSEACNRKNVMHIILEGVGSTFINSFNPHHTTRPVADHALTPFLDSLAAKSLCFTECYTHIRKSSSGITAHLGGMPAYNPFVYIFSPYQGNTVETTAAHLRREGYSTTFFCGCNKGSYGLCPLSKVFGFDSFYDRTSYEAEYGGINYDGHWGIYDHAMAQVVLDKASHEQKPFYTVWFTLCSHGPYALPDSYKGRFSSPDKSMEQMVEYIDDVLRELFAQASQQPWYNNTIFVISADHGHVVEQTLYNNSVQLNRIPLLIYTPDGSIPATRQTTVCGQIDIPPTILDLVAYPRPYFALGKSLLRGDNAGRFVVFDDQTDLLIGDGTYTLRLNRQTLEPLALYAHQTDAELANDILPQMADTDLIDRLCVQARAFMQDYTSRVIDNRMAETITE